MNDLGRYARSALNVLAAVPALALVALYGHALAWMFRLGVWPEQGKPDVDSFGGIDLLVHRGLCVTLVMVGYWVLPITAGVYLVGLIGGENLWRRMLVVAIVTSLAWLFFLTDLGGCFGWYLD